jgi:hypothetical protein
LAYFELSANESVDPGEILKHAQTAAAAGLAIDADELSEKTGYALTTAEREIPTAKFQAPSNPQNPNSKIQNRAADADGLAARMERLLAADDEHFADELAALRAELPALLADADDAAVAAWEKLLGGELLAGLTGRAPIKNTTDDNGMEHDADDGKFTGKDGGADGDKKTPAPAPKRISAADADKLLAKGFTEKSADGHEVKFGARLKQHLEAAPDAAARKEYLAWGREAVRSGDRRRDTEQGEGRDYYGKTFAEGGKAKGVMVIVSVKDGEAFNLYRAHPNYLRKKGLANRGDELGEHPPIVVLRAFADAGSAPDWLQVALNGMKVNHKKSGEQS